MKSTSLRAESLLTVPEAQASDSTSIEALLKALAPRFRSISCRHHIDVPDAEDVLQNTLVRYVHMRRPVADLGAWLSIVFRRECLRFLRERTRRLELAVDAEEISNASAPAPHLAPEERMYLKGVLATLPPKKRRILWWRYAMGMSEEEVADSAGCKVSSAKKAISRALQALRQIVRRQVARSKLVSTQRTRKGLATLP